MAEDSDPLKIGEAPPAFKEFAEKHNALWNLIRTAVGYGGAKVVVSKGKIIIDVSETQSTSELHYDDGFISIDIDGNGIVFRPYNGGSSTRYFIWGNAGGHVLSFEDNEVVIANETTGKSLAIPYADITQNMGIKTIDVCDSGSPAQMLVIGSDPF